MYDVWQNFCAGGFGSRWARGGHHGEGGTGADFEDDRLFADHDVVDQVLPARATTRLVLGERR
jgi:hypothetical protein